MVLIDGVYEFKLSRRVNMFLTHLLISPYYLLACMIYLITQFTPRHEMVKKKEFMYR